MWADGNSSHLTALAFYGNRIFAKGLFCCGGVDAEALMESESGITGQAHGEDIVVAVGIQCLVQHLVELCIAPGAVHAAKPPPLQFDAQFMVGRQFISGVGHFIMKEPDGRQIGLDGAGRFATVL